MKLYKVIGKCNNSTEHLFREISSLGLLCTRCYLLIHYQDQEYYKIINFSSATS